MQVKYRLKFEREVLDDNYEIIERKPIIQAQIMQPLEELYALNISEDDANIMIVIRLAEEIERNLRKEQGYPVE